MPNFFLSNFLCYLAGMKTRDKILQTALVLFNEQGIGNISSKHISTVLGISYGNLCYHFPKKDDIVLQLYLDMQAEIDARFKQIEDNIFDFEFLLQSLRGLFQILYKYKFVYLGITKVIRHFEKIKRHAQKQNHERQKLLNDLGKVLVENGYMKPFDSKEQKDMMIHTLLIIINSWISDAEVFFDKSEDKVDYYVKLFFTVTKSTLTEKGLHIFEQVYANNFLSKNQ